MSHWHVIAVARAFKRQEKSGAGLLNITWSAATISAMSTGGFGVARVVLTDD